MSGENRGLAAKYQSLFSGVLQQNEILLTAYAAIYVKISELLGRGAGDGTLGVTSLRVIHLGQHGGGLYLSRNEIISVRKSWIILPGSSSLNIKLQKSGTYEEYEFYCGTGFCKDVISLLG